MKIIILLLLSFSLHANEELQKEREQFKDWKVNAVNKQIKLSKATVDQVSEHQTQLTEDILHDYIQLNVIDATQVILDAN